MCSVVSDSVTPRTVAHQAPLSMEFSRQEYLNGLSFPSPGDLPDPEIQPRSPASQADSLPPVSVTMKGNTVTSQPKLRNLFNKDLWELMTWQKQFNKGCRDRYLLPLSSGNSLLIWKNKLISSVAPSCPTLCDPMDCRTSGLSVHHQLPKFIEGTIISVIRTKIKIHTKYDEEGVTERSESFQRKWDILT